MRSSNPVLSKPDTWQVDPAQTQGQYQAQFGQPGQYAQYAQPGQPGQYVQDPNQAYPALQAPGRMTIDDVITKSAITIGALMVTAALTFLFLPAALLMPAAIVSGIVAFGTVMVVSFRRAMNPAFVLAYAAIEGVFIGAISKVYENAWNGIVPAALMATLVAAAATLGAYKFFRIKVTSKFRKMVMIGTIAYAGVLFVNMILSFFGMGFLFAGGNLGFLLLFSAIGVGLAVFNLILDFDYIEQGIAMGASATESWRAAFGLTVTLVWLYIEMLRLLSYFRSN
ncbi:MAG TPA: Bax inhibitor-1/YccA family protein [Propionicimonas sp.]|nr:Bax inhibitor-1/YccA family protein [Propionicimonas sp.]HRA05457.1 Bax inhibitor-1/YccA family protein [Propionicimonas sp.]